MRKPQPFASAGDLWPLGWPFLGRLRLRTHLAVWQRVSLYSCG